jgi:hypothetical protein
MRTILFVCLFVAACAAMLFYVGCLDPATKSRVVAAAGAQASFADRCLLLDANDPNTWTPDRVKAAKDGCVDANNYLWSLGADQ